MTQLYSFLRGLLLLAVVGGSLSAHAQGVGIGGPPNAAAALDITSSTKGLLLPRLTDAQMQVLTPVAGMLVYNTDQAGVYSYQGAKAATLIDQTAASSTSFTALNTKQNGGSVTQSFTAVAKSCDYLTVYCALIAVANLGSDPAQGNVGVLQATFSIKNAAGTVLGSANGLFPVTANSTPLTLAFSTSGLVVGQTYYLTMRWSSETGDTVLKSKKESKFFYL